MRLHLTWMCIGLLIALPQASAQQAPWQLPAQPSVTIGSLDGDLPYQLERVTGAVRLTDGSIVVGNSGSSELRYFDANGKHLKSVSRRGAGPGEFDQFSSIRPFLIGQGRLIAQDGGSQRVNVFDVSGKYLRQFRFAPQPAAALVVLVTADVTGIIGRSLRDAALRGNPGDILEAKFQFAMFDSLGVQRNSLFELPGRRRYVNSHQGITHYPYIPLSAEPAVAASGGRIYIVRGDSAVVEVWSTEGRRLTSFRWPAQRTRVREIWARYKSVELAAMTQERDRVLYGHLFEQELPLSEFVPIATQIQVDGSGNLWIERFRFRWDPDRRWDVLDRQGRLLGSVSVPARLEVYQVGSDFMLGRTRDSLDVEQVQLWQLSKRP
jgi:hypothetical protein